MLKLAVAVLAVAFAGSASAERWRDLRVDASSEAAFAKSLEAFKEKLSPARQSVFGEALQDIWIQGEAAAEAAQREYTAAEYYKLLDGMRYEEVVTYTDPTGDTAKRRYRNAAQSARYAHPPAAQSSAYRFTNDGGGRWGTDPNGHPTRN